MRFVGGYPVMSKATDCMDSAMFNGVLATFGHFQSVGPWCYVRINSVVIRCSEVMNDRDWSQNPLNVTLDQIIPTMTGLIIRGHTDRVKLIATSCRNRGWKAQNTEADRPGSVKPWWNGPDRIVLAQREFMKNLINGTKDDFWLKTYINFHAKFTPLKEANQLMCLCKTAGDKYLKMWRDKNSQWKICIFNYYYARGEPDVSNFLIAHIENL